MPVVILKKENISNSYDVGEHILGRGKELQCTSKKVSRKHGLLKISEQGVYLESTHNNPCFHKPNKISNVDIVTFGNNVKLSDNDQIALCLDHGWFIVQFQQNDIKNDADTTYENALTQPLNCPLVSNDNTVLNNETDSTSNNTILNNQSNGTTLTQPLKRPIEDENNEAQAKKQKSDDIPTEDIKIKIEPIDEPSSSNDNSACTLPIKEEPADDVEIKTEEITIKGEIKNEEIKNEDKNNNEDCEKADSDKPSTSGTSKRPWRDRCWYGIECYRKNSNHRIELSHPGDSDYDSDPNDTRPICCYGADCYRKNRDHRRRYRHPGQKKIGKKPPPQPPKRRIRKKPVDPLSQNSEELDEYDYSDPFIDDGSEDEYEPSQEIDTESDYEDSQDVQEDNKRLMKEARKFTRNKK